VREVEVVREWPANEAGRRAAELARARGQLVHAERVGDVVRVVLRVPDRSTPTAPRQTTTRPRQVRWRVALAVAAAVLLLGAVVWGVVLVVAWAAAHVAQLVGIGVVLALLGAVVVRIAVGGGGGDHPCNR
jgi:uncharacterized membrane protein YcjF (UPF0283 family)